MTATLFLYNENPQIVWGFSIALGLALWEWQRSKLDEIYVTVFPKHKSLIKLLTRFGFNLVGTNLNHE